MLERDDELPRDIAQQLAVVRRNADRLLVLVSDLLSTAQIESRTLRMVREPSDLGALVQQSVRSLEPRALEAGVALRAEVPSTPKVLVDPARITQVVDNLLSNAVKYTLPGGAVQVRLEEEGTELVLTVADSGIGIAEQDLDQVFTKFFRAESAERRAIPGVGLGLVISKEIIEAHEGTIELESTEGEGTTVRVRLPVAHR